MKKIFLLLYIAGFYSFGQTTTQNYVKVTKPRIPAADWQLTIPDSDKNITVQYYDGLGRPIQVINVSAGGNNENIVQHTQYDNLGRQDRDYLPFPVTASDASGSFITTAITPLNSYYNNLFGTTQINAYSEKKFENSELLRVLEQAAPGESWSMSNGHTIKYKYRTNQLNEVRRFAVGFSTADTEKPSLLYNGFYHTGQLTKVVTKDENWTTADGNNKTIQEFKDKEGKIILKRAFNNGSAHDTYYVYDKYSNLTFVLPPEASDNIVPGVVPQIYARNYPWTTLCVVDGKLAEDYNKELEDYDNGTILNIDLLSEYGGQGGFTLSQDNEGNLLLALNFTLNEPISLKNGIIASLAELGEFSNREIGRITDKGYEYIFLINDNYLVVEGSGLVPTTQKTLNAKDGIEYSQNYPWTTLSNVSQEIREEYEAAISGMDNSEILSAIIPNSYNATGGASVSVSKDSQLNISININSETPLSLKDGIIIPLNLGKALENKYLGSIQGSTYAYSLSLFDNNIYVSGSGSFTNLIYSGSFTENAPQDMEVSQPVIDGLCYIYHYDRKNRLVEKKIPGKGWEYIVYDKLDRPVLNQDANLRQGNNWLFNKYDIFGRVVYTGKFRYVSPNANTNSLLRKELQAIYDNASNINESRSQTGFYTNDYINIRYTNNVFPTITPQDYNYTVLNVNYYDNYSFEPYDIVGNLITVPATNSYNISILTQPKTLLTGTLSGSEGGGYTLTVIGYDKKSNPVWEHYEGLSHRDITHRNIDYITGNILETNLSHTYFQTNNTIVKTDKFKYDHADRLLKHTQIVGNHGEELISFNKYDGTGQLIKKKVGGPAPAANDTFDNCTTALQTIDYTYNIRGWLTAINNPEANLTDDLFAFKINYDTPQNGATALYNGNISETKWRTKSNANNQVRGYKYGYDHLNRVIQADYTANYPLVANNSENENYTEGNITYDKNGNILHLDRYGLTNSATNIDKIDALQYLYDPLSNKLKKVVDSGDLAAGFKYVPTTLAATYTYDLNGNLIKDSNKGITNIEYNHLNLPTRIIFNGGDPAYSMNNHNAIIIAYDASGQKLDKTVHTTHLDGNGNFLPPTATYTVYCRDFTYENDALQFISQPEGYIKYENGTFSYIYNYKDHLGNNRLSYMKNNGSLEIVEENNYYPFGLKHKGYNDATSTLGNYNAQKHKYNGKEWQEEKGLNMYDYGARNYDPAIGRWMNIDPLSEMSIHLSTYNYCYNNPLYFIDPDGMLPSDEETVGADGLTNKQWIQASKQRNSSHSPPPGINLGDLAASASLIATSQLYLDGKDATNMTEKEKQEYFKKDALYTIGILLYEFATGTGKAKRDFIQGIHPFADQFLKGYVLNHIVDGINKGLTKDKFNTWKNISTKLYDIEIPFSPTSKPSSWGGSIAKHITSNEVQFFVGGALGTGRIHNNTLTGTIINHTSRRSLFLHLFENYDRKNGSRPLSTITQIIHFSFPLPN